MRLVPDDHFNLGGSNTRSANPSSAPTADYVDPEFLETLIGEIEKRLDAKVSERVAAALQASLPARVVEIKLDNPSPDEWIPYSRKLTMEARWLLLRSSSIYPIEEYAPFSIVRWKNSNRKIEYALKVACAFLLFFGGTFLSLSGHLEFIFITVIGTALIILDIFTRIGSRPWKYR